MAQVDGATVQLILDSGSSGSVITKQFLEKVGRKVDQPSNINMIGINGEKRKAQGEIKSLPIVVQQQLLPINVVVSEATGYDVLVGNDWLTKYQAKLDWEKQMLTFSISGKTFTADAACWKKITVVEDSDDEFEQEQPSFHVEFENESFMALDDGLQVNNEQFSWDYLEWVEQYDDLDEEFDKESLRQKIELLPPEERRRPKIIPGQVIKYFDNGGIGKQPARAYESDAGLDLFYTGEKPLVLSAQTVTAIDTNIAFEIPVGTFAKIESRSSMAKKGIHAVGGVCDAGYTGNIIVQLQNTTSSDYSIQRNDKIAQIIFLPLVSIEKLQRVQLRDELKASSRSTKGFGSSDQLQAEFSTESLTDNQQQQLNKLLEEYQDLFDKNLGKCGIVKHEIDTGMERPIKQHAYQRPMAEKKIIQQEIEKMLEQGAIRESSSSWTSPVVLAKKKNGETRFCVDYRKLNKITRKDCHPLPRIDDLLDSFQGSTCFTTLDLASGYWQIEVDPADREKTAFITDQGIYEFNVMPFGLTNAPATFQRMMNRVFTKINGDFVVVYLDDLNIFSRNFNEHLVHLREVFERLRNAGLKLKRKKCYFFKKELAFLGHIISEKGIHPDPDKITAVNNQPPPTNLRELRQFLGLASYYRKFVEGFAKIAAPLNQLMKKEISYEWEQQHQEAFEYLKKRLVTTPILAHPDFNKPFVIMTDASALGLGAVLSQKDDNGRETVIRYASRRTNDAERSYSATNLECLAVVWAVQYFRKYVAGTRFQIITDHSAITSLMKTQNPRGQMARWIIALQEYDFEVIYRPGRIHSNVDTLSRSLI
jgi:deoxyuridine 5'-triphosphate nucleotidohydrolase